MPTRENAQPCTCGAVERCAADQRYPVEYDAQCGCYRLQSWDRKWVHDIRYCFFCGGALQDRTDEWFSVPEDGELKQVLSELSGKNCVDDVLGALGNPDRTSALELFNTIPGAAPRRQVRQLFYGSKWKTLDLHVTEYEDGAVQFAVSGKYVGPARGAGEGDGSSIHDSRPWKSVVPILLFLPAFVLYGFLVSLANDFGWTPTWFSALQPYDMVAFSLLYMLGAYAWGRAVQRRCEKPRQER